MAPAIETEPGSQAVERFVLYNIDWAAYEAIACAIGDRPTRLTFDGWNLELRRTSFLHEWTKCMFGRLVECLTFATNIPLRGGGSTTLKRRGANCGIDPDACYWIQSEQAVRGNCDLDFANYPLPDLAIEIEISRSALDRIAVYAKVGIPEVWRFDGVSLQIHLLQPAGTYIDSQTSHCLPQLPVHELVPFLQPDDELDDTTRVRQFVEWAGPRFKHQ
jgi:Uma2 family endonuclease